VNSKDPNSITLQSIVRQSENQVSADMDGEVAMMSIENGKYYCLNETSSRIWQLIEQPRAVGDICSVLQGEFDVQPDQCEAEVLEHVQELVSDNLIQVVDAAAA